MGRIGQSLIMLGQPPYCSLFSVWRVDEGGYMRVGIPVVVCEHARVCTWLCTVQDGTRVLQGKSPHLISSSTSLRPSRLCLFKLDFILQKQSGMDKSFSSPYFDFFFLSFFPSTYFSLYSFLAFFFFYSPLFPSHRAST